MEKYLSSPLAFTEEEKLAIIKMVDHVILADSKVAPEEMRLLTSLMIELNFDGNFVGQARNLPKDIAIKILSGMSSNKKKTFSDLLDSTAISDGFLHEKEQALIVDTLEKIDLLR